MNNWISVKERVPEKNDDVLVYDGYNNEVDMAYLDSDYEWISLTNNLVFHEGDIDYWMPLPDPPVIIDCSKDFDPDLCSTCKHYGECVTAKYLEYAQQAPSP